MLAHALRDIRYALRQLGRAPGFTVVAILTLGLGAGATTTIFSVVNGVLLRPLPYPDDARLMRVNEVVPQYGRFSVAPANFLDWRKQNAVFERIAAYQMASATLATPGGPERLQGALVSWDMFDLLGVAPARGAGFTAAQDQPGANTVVVLSDGAWHRRFSSDPNIVGTTISLNGVPVTVVGVMPPGFFFPARTGEFWRPIALNPANASRGGHFLGVLGRLKPGVAQAQAAAEMKTIAERLAAQYPDSSAKESAEVIALREQLVADVRPALLTLLAAVTVVVLIACANVANLLLARAAAREKEMAIRAALGAGSRRLAMQMIVESLVLGISGGAVGLLLAYLCIAPIQSLGASSVPRAADIRIDPMVLIFALGISMLTGLLFGLAPAWHASRATVGTVLKETGRSSVGGGRRLRNVLLVGEMALSIVLLIGAALLLRSFAKLVNVNPGFDASRVLAFQVALPQAGYPQPANRMAFYDALLENLANAPGVRSAGMIQSLPMRGDYVLSFDIIGRPPLPPGDSVSAGHRSVAPGYFATMGIPLKRGRLLAPTDTDTSPSVAVIDESFVRKHFPNEDPIGHRIKIGNGHQEPCEIVGVVGDVHYESLDATTAPTMYVPFKQDPFSGMWVLLRTDGDPAELGGLARDTLRGIDKMLPAFSIMPLATVVSDSVAQRRFSMLLLGLFAGVALFLAAVGLYGVVSYAVSQRRREIGLRMAIGAEPRDVLKMVLGSGMKLALIGVAVGLTAAFALTRLVSSLLFDVAPTDPASYLVTTSVLLAVAAVACYIPARRAMRVDPVVALQE